jgi:Bacterial extracellular solute-binding proteins, family 5 Middle/Pentapeptide repeats (8 copies)
MPNQSTRMLGFIAGKFDLLSLQPPMLKDGKSQAPQAVCDLVPDNAARMLILNRAAPPFDNPELRRAMALSLDRKAFIDILREGQGDIGGAMLPPPEGVWLDFSGFDLSRADLRGTDLRGTNLSAANLSGAHLERANFFKAVLDAADLAGVFLNGAQFLNCAQLVVTRNWQSAFRDDALACGAAIPGRTQPE